jgi:hypothetical protein
MKSFLLFAVVGLVFGGIALGLGFFLWSEVALVQGAAAFGLTFVPAVLTLAWALYSYRSTPELQLMASMGGSGVRMAIALGGGFLLTQSHPETFDGSFWFWILTFYMTFLAAEIAVILRQQPKTEQAAPAQ